MQKIPVYVISLERSKARRESMKAHLEGLGISFTIVDAVDGAALGPEKIKELADKDISVGDIGCYLSHIKAYKIFMESKEPVALILEDDVVLSPKVKFLLDHGCESLDFDYCFLSCRNKNANGPVFYDKDADVLLCQGLKAYVLSGWPLLAHAYLVTSSAVERRLKVAFPIMEAIDRYEYLPYKPRFRRVVPDAAWLNKNSLMSEIRPGSVALKSKFPFLSQYTWFYPFRDLIYVRALKRYLLKQKLIADGKLEKGIRWGALPSLREMMRLE